MSNDDDSPLVGFALTTYEQDSTTPTLAHVFFGATLRDAERVARSHIVTDYFFRSSLLGEMRWRGDVVRLRNSRARWTVPPVRRRRLTDAVRRLKRYARRVWRDSERTERAVQQLSEDV